jgi:23S rRNA-/tRNA-specific pseudouridylate synthase
MSDRLLLHAEEISILHPRTRVPITFHANCPFSLEEY